MSSRTRLLTPGQTNLNRTKVIRTAATEAKQTEAATRIEPKTSAALPCTRCALSTELSRSRDNLAQNGT